MRFVRLYPIAVGSLSMLTFVTCGKDDGGGMNAPTQCVNVTGTVMAGALEIRRPEADPAACKEVDHPTDPEARECEGTTLDLSCIGTKEPFSTPAMVTMRGCVDTFGLGADSYGLTIGVLREKSANGTAVDPGYDISGVAGMQANTTPSAFLGQTISTQVADTECDDRGAYVIAGIPTETALIVRVTHQNERSEDRLYVDTYQYNFAIRNTSIVDAMDMPVTDPSTCTPQTCFVTEAVNTIAIATFRTIPRAAGVSVITGENDLFDGIGQGHVAGEVQDCTSENTMQNAVVAIDARARKLAYFNVGFPPDRDNLADPKPEGTRTRTNADGLYVAIGVDTMTGGQPLTVGAAMTRSVCGPDGICMCTETKQPNPMWTAADAGEGVTEVLGSRTVYVFPDSITIMTFDRALYTAE